MDSNKIQSIRDVVSLIRGVVRRCFLNILGLVFLFCFAFSFPSVLFFVFCSGCERNSQGKGVSRVLVQAVRAIRLLHQVSNRYPLFVCLIDFEGGGCPLADKDKIRAEARHASASSICVACQLAEHMCTYKPALRGKR